MDRDSPINKSPGWARAAVPAHPSSSNKDKHSAVESLKNKKQYSTGESSRPKKRVRETTPTPRERSPKRPRPTSPVANKQPGTLAPAISSSLLKIPGLESHPIKSRDLLNNPITNFEELCLICGDDQATGQFACSIYKPFGVGYNEGVNEIDLEIEDMGIALSHNGSQSEEPSCINSTTPNKSRGSRSSIMDDEIVKGVRDMSYTLREAKKYWIELLSDVLFTMDDEYDKDDLDIAFKVLCYDEQSAHEFVHRRLAMRKKWTENFLTSSRTDL
ncbi:hypothetical protein J5N97_010999 [Dioscorea zingiberensis]|uniref:Uncharacterized protein n=1 Tax=Dioscorea zingiberensis TaxID=325984 RepID=A0A9D5HN32_9LILI|nr:hypothetical protein J5N97_010999 [Dioscorea zingiberensis]